MFAWVMFYFLSTKPSVLWCCWLGGRKGIRPVKNWVVGCWRGYLSGARCRLAYGPADATPPLTVSCFSKVQIGFTFLVLAHPGSPGQRAVKRVCMFKPRGWLWCCFMINSRLSWRSTVLSRVCLVQRQIRDFSMGVFQGIWGIKVRSRAPGWGFGGLRSPS